MTDTPPPRSASLIERLIRALLLQPAVYAEASANRRLTGQAVMIVLLGGVLNGIALQPRLGSLAMWAGVANAVFGWLLWTGVILLIARLFGHRRDGRSLLRPLGFAAAPNVLLILGLLPAIGSVLRIIVVVWSLATTAIALEAVFTMRRRRAVVIALAGFVLYWLIGWTFDYVSGELPSPLPPASARSAS